MNPEKISVNYHKTPYGELIIGSYQNKLCLCDWRYRKMRTRIDQRICKGLDTEYQEGTSKIIEKTEKQFSEYFKKERTQFTIPLLLIGTEFQKKVWNALLEIPYGQTKSYLELSKLMKQEKAIRAVAAANGANAISILVPCHRIIGSDGKLVGYAGGLNQKKKLLELEGAIQTNQLSLF